MRSKKAYEYGRGAESGVARLFMPAFLISMA